MNVDDLKLNNNLIKAIKELGFVEFTDIQEKCIPIILKGQDIFGQSKTGSGKTAAFGLSILENINPGKGIQALVLTPTRELCIQVTAALNEFGKYINSRAINLYGGVSIGPQIAAVKRADIIVGTPGRIIDHLSRKTISFEKIRYLVLDEADKMFEMGFVEAVEEILRYTPNEKQTLLFSATLSKNVNHIVKKHLKNPIIIKSHAYVDRGLLKQVYYNIKSYEKFSLLVHLLKKNILDLVLVFCATRRGVDVLNQNLRRQDIKTIAIHGGLTQNRRQNAMDEIKKEHIKVLIATDIASRGLDINNVNYVYNYDVPKTPEEYIHRIGRTARAGKKGEAITLVTERDNGNFDNVLSNQEIKIQKEQLPDFKKVPFISKNRFHDSRRTGYDSRRTKPRYQNSSKSPF